MRSVKNIETEKFVFTKQKLTMNERLIFFKIFLFAFKTHFFI